MASNRIEDYSKNQKIMKKFMLTMGLTVISAIGFGQVYNHTHELKNGAGELINVDFKVVTEHTEGGFFEITMDPSYTDRESEANKEVTAYRVLVIANVYAKYSCNNLSWVPTSLTMVYDEENNYYIGQFRGTTINTYGVRDNISTFIKMDMEGNVGPF